MCSSDLTEHQLAIAANCEVDPLTMEDVEAAIVAQKVRCTAKQLKQFIDATQKVVVNGAFLTRKSKVDVRSYPTWKRSEIERSDIEVEGKSEHEGEGLGYTNRRRTCPVCKGQVETAGMQLFTPLGFRYVNCTGCSTQGWSRGWLCECGVAWHTCPTHRCDPGAHRSTKTPKKKVQDKEEHRYKDSERRARRRCKAPQATH